MAGTLDMNITLFIDLVQAHPNIFDKSLKTYKDDILKRKSFQQIAQVFNISEAEALNKWRNLRDKYCREKRKLLPSGSGTCFGSEWPYLKQMSFLAKHIKARQTYSNSKKEECLENDSTQIQYSSSDVDYSENYTSVHELDEDENLEIVQEESASGIVHPPQPTIINKALNTPTARKRQRNDASELLDLASDIAEQVRTVRTQQPVARNANAAFGEYIAKRLDDLSVEDSSEMRRRIVDLIESEGLFLCTLSHCLKKFVLKIILFNPILAH